jgi:purine-nucleoside phosphorylase
MSLTHTDRPEALRAQIDEAVAAIRARVALVPEVAVILGTGLGSLSDSLTIDTVLPYGEIPHFVASTVEGHRGEFVFGRLAGRPAVVMSGRVHYYEGYTMRQVSFPVRVMQALGATTLIVSNAVGGMNPLFDKGDIMIVTDHINLMGDNPLLGPNDETLGPRFPDMSEPYDRSLIRLAEDVALEQKLAVKKGVFVAVAGPNLETAAEYRFLRGIGADVVGMSLVPENLVAVHGGLRMLAFSVVTDRCWPDALEPVDIPKILAAAAAAAPRLDRLVSRVVERLDEAPPRPRSQGH